MRWLALIVTAIGVSCSAPHTGARSTIVGRWVLAPQVSTPVTPTQPASTSWMIFRPDGTYTTTDTFTGTPSSESGTWRQADGVVWLKPTHAPREIHLELRGDELIDRAPYEPGVLVYRREAAFSKSDSR